jgi:hypothetical protein
MAVFLANIGANAGHAARSPLFGDGRFVLIPIPEPLAWQPPMLRLRDVPSMAMHVSPAYARLAVHLDPDFISGTPTYGDNCRRAPRAYALRSARPGDRIVFLARLHPPAGPAAFYLVGHLTIADILADVTADPGRGWWDSNAHVRRARAGGRWDSFWVFRGTPESGYYQEARPFRRQEAELLCAGTWRWRESRTELQTIGSYTRTIRPLRSGA